MADYVQEEEIAEHIATVHPLPSARQRVVATPYQWKTPQDIRPREFLYGRHYIRKFVSGTVAPGGVGKSTQALVEAIAMASGRDLLGLKVKEPIAVWYWNGEDPLDEIERKVVAICLHYRISEQELGGRLFLNSGRDCEIMMASETKSGFSIAEPVVDDLIETLRENRIDAWILDPFVSLHEVSENDNNKIGAVVKTFARIADATNTACDLVHHAKKTPALNNDDVALDARGAGAFVDRCRSVRTLVRMTKEEAERFGLDVTAREHRAYFRVEPGKMNLSPASTHTIWRHLVDVPLGNGADGLREDHVGVVTPWKPTDAMGGFKATDTLAVQKKIHSGEYRWDPRSPEWVGLLILEVLEWSADDAACKSLVRQMLNDWTKNELIEVVEETDEKRRKRKFVRVKKWIEL